MAVLYHLPFNDEKPILLLRFWVKGNQQSIHGLLHRYIYSLVSLYNRKGIKQNIHNVSNKKENIEQVIYYFKNSYNMRIYLSWSQPCNHRNLFPVLREASTEDPEKGQMDTDYLRKSQFHLQQNSEDHIDGCL